MIKIKISQKALGPEAPALFATLLDSKGRSSSVTPRIFIRGNGLAGLTTIAWVALICQRSRQASSRLLCWSCVRLVAKECLLASPRRTSSSQCHQALGLGTWMRSLSSISRLPYRLSSCTAKIAYSSPPPAPLACTARHGQRHQCGTRIHLAGQAQS